MMMPVLVFFAFRLMPVTLLPVFSHLCKAHRLAAGTVVVAITRPVTLMGTRGFDHNHPLIVAVRICHLHMSMDARQDLPVYIDFDLTGLYRTDMKGCSKKANP
jgi:hypothetical protein